MPKSVQEIIEESRAVRAAIGRQTAARRPIAAGRGESLEARAERAVVDLERINARERRMASVRANRPGFLTPNTRTGADTPEASERRKSFLAWVRDGRPRAALQTSSDTSGGVFVPLEISSVVRENLIYADQIRRAATVLTTATDTLRIPQRTANSQAQWLAETDTDSTTGPSYGATDIPISGIRCEIPVSNDGGLAFVKHAPLIAFPAFFRAFFLRLFNVAFQLIDLAVTLIRVHLGFGPLLGSVRRRVGVLCQRRGGDDGASAIAVIHGGRPDREAKANRRGAAHEGRPSPEARRARQDRDKQSGEHETARRLVRDSEAEGPAVLDIDADGPAGSNREQHAPTNLSAPPFWGSVHGWIPFRRGFHMARRRSSARRAFCISRWASKRRRCDRMRLAMAPWHPGRAWRPWSAQRGAGFEAFGIAAPVPCVRYRGSHGADGVCAP
jgi:hypothetical protein